MAEQPFAEIDDAVIMLPAIESVTVRVESVPIDMIFGCAPVSNRPVIVCATRLVTPVIWPSSITIDTFELSMRFRFAIIEMSPLAVSSKEHTTEGDRCNWKQ